MLFSAFAVQFRALHIFAIALHIDAVRCRCFAALPESSPCHRQAILNFALPQLCFISPRHAFASQYRCKPTRSALCHGLSLLRDTCLCHCHATLKPCGACFGVAHRSGPRNMALAYRFHHDQAWQLPNDGADDVDLVRIRIRVPDSVTDLNSVSPSFDRRHRPADVFIR